MSLKDLVLSENSTHQLATNLQELLKSQNVDINQVAHALGIPPMTIRRLLSGETTDPRISTLKLVADHFGITIDSLIEANNPLLTTSSKRNKPHFVPILDWNTAENMTTITDLDLSKWNEWQPITLNEEDALAKNAFALVSRPSMYPRFPQGTLFIIDPDIAPLDGDTILVKMKHNNELTLRELCIDPPEWLLQPIVPGSKMLPFSNQEHRIVGVNLLTMLYNRRANG